VPFAPNPFRTSATRRLTFCVPDEWYRRSKFRQVPAISHEPSEETIRRLADLDDRHDRHDSIAESDENGDEDDDDDDDAVGTAKQKDAPQSPKGVSSPIQSFNSGAEWRGTVAQRRLSSLFDSWKGPSEVQPSPPTTPDRKSVSEPMLMGETQKNTLSRSNTSDSTESSDSEMDDTDFEEMLVSCYQLHSVWELC
jgi:diaphanous 1